jgi:uncharacterized protein (UPF0335 family)
MDIEVCLEAKRIADNQLNKAIEEIDRLKKQEVELRKELDVMYQKVINVEKDRDQMKTIMTQNITESNAKINLYVDAIQNLKKKIRELTSEG